MMKDFSISMALLDFIPVFLFAMASALLMRNLYNKMSKIVFAFFSAGMIDILIAGALKALYKLLYATGVCDFEPLSQIFFPVQSLGFLLAGIGMLSMLFPQKTKQTTLAVFPPLFSGTFLFVGLMVAGLGMIDAVLCILAIKLKRPTLIGLFLLSFACSLGMGYLSSRDFTEASINWIAEGINTVGQGSLLLGAILLRKNGLETLRIP